MKEISLSEILEMFKTSSTVNEFILRCTVLDVDPNALMKVLNEFTINMWSGQWINNQQNRKVSLSEFFEMKRELESNPERCCQISDLSDLCRQMCYLVSLP